MPAPLLAALSTENGAATPAHATLPLIVARPVAVALAGCSERSFQRLEAAGVVRPHTPARGQRASTYDAVALVSALRVHERRRTGTAEPPRDARDRSQAELNMLRLRREEGKLLPVDEVLRAGQNVVLAAKAKLLSLPWRLISGGAAPPTAEGAIRLVLHEVLSELVALRDLTTAQRRQALLAPPADEDDDDEEREEEQAERARRAPKPKPIKQGKEP